MNFYFEAAKTLDRLNAKQGSVKSVLSTLPDKDRKRTAALVIETLKYKSALTDVIVSSKLLEEERKITSRSLALVLVHDVLLSKGIQAGDGPIKQAILRHKTRLHAEFIKIKIKHGAKANTELAQTGDARADQMPRYVRVNTLKTSLEETIKAYVSKGYEIGDPLQAKKFAKDQHIPDLLLFPPQTQFHEDLAYTSGRIILQDKASCFPATVLAPPARDDCVVIDATAAPGNKTSHLSALMQNKGKLFAFERDRRRFSTLKTMLDKAGCRNTEALNIDFLTTNPEDIQFAEVTHILLDPSCSGSGIVNRLDYLLEPEEVSEENLEGRLNKLSSFQLMMIRHAMKFPSVQKIVYSTCSIHAIENEHVVQEAINSAEARTGAFKLASPDMVLPEWHRRGLPDKLSNPVDAAALVRCSPGEDATNGFFVSCFVRCDSSMTDPTGRKDPKHPSKKRRVMEGSGDNALIEQGKGRRHKKRKTKAGNA